MDYCIQDYGPNRTEMANLSGELPMKRKTTLGDKLYDNDTIDDGKMRVGQRVRHSGYVTNSKRDYWNQCGHEPAKSRAKKALEDAIAERGTISKVLHNGYEVKWDNGSVSQCLSYLVIEAKD